MTRSLLLDGNAVTLTTCAAAAEPLPGEAVIIPHRFGLARLDLEIAALGNTGTRVLGHEFVGTVEAVNGNDRSNLTGKRVVGSINTFCGECDRCTGGLSAHCPNRTLLGLQGRNGCFTHSFTLPAINLVPVPDAVDDDHAIFANQLAAAIQAERQLTIEGKPYITVLGDGPLGLLTVQRMAQLNASVRLIGRHTEKLALCEKWGIKHRHLDDIGRRADQDVVVDCTGAPDGLDVASQLVRPRGKILLKTLHRQPTVPALNNIVHNEIEVIGSAFGPVSEAMTALARREVDVVSLITRRMGFNDAEKAWAAAASPGVIKILMDA